MSTPRPSQKKQASLTSFFSLKSSQPSVSQTPSRSQAQQASQTQQAQPSPPQSQLPSRKRPLKTNGQTQGAPKTKPVAKPVTKPDPPQANTSTDKEVDADDDDDSGRSRFLRAVKRARTVADDSDEVMDDAGEELVPDVEIDTEPALPNALSSTATTPALPSSGRTDRFVYGGRTAEAREVPSASQDSDSDDAATKAAKAELHRRFVKKLAHPDALARRRVPEAGEAGDADDNDNDNDNDDDDERPKKGGRKSKLTPLEVQFLAIKRAHLDTVLVVEVGYKFKFLGEDARVAARVLGIVCIPGKVRYDEHASEAHLDRFASASIPVPRLGVHVKRLVAAGLKVGVVRQMETAALKKAGDNRNAPFVRQLTQVYTKGTYIEEDELTTDRKEAGSGYLLCLTETAAGGAGADERVRVGLLAVQPATGDIVYDSFDDGFLRDGVETRLLHIAPCEILIVGETDVSDMLTRATEKMLQHLSGSATNVFGDRTRIERVARVPAADAAARVAQFYADKDEALLAAALALPGDVTACLAAMLAHLTEYGLQHIFDLTRYFASFTTRQHMLLGGTTLESLEVYRNATDHRRHGSLLWALDKTHTRSGHRLLRKWIGQPLLDRAALLERGDAVAELLAAAGTARRDKLEALVAGQGGAKIDLERSLIRIYYGKCTRSEAVAVLEALQRIAGAYAGLPGSLAHAASTGFASPLVVGAIARLPAVHRTVTGFLERVDAAAAARNDKYQFFRDAHETDDIITHKLGIAAVESDLDAHRREVAAVLGRATPPAYVTVAGIEFLVEVPNGGAELKRVPASWTKVSGTKRASRFHTPAAVRLVAERDQHREALAAACDSAFRDFLHAIAAHYQPLRDAVAALATLDCLLSLSKVAALPGYTRPTLLDADDADDTDDADESAIQIDGGRHPVAEHTLAGGYIPFSARLGANETNDGPRALLVTGPNMGGKSSFVRAVALLALMAQIGSFVPADAMSLTMQDAVFVRMGARDNLFAGESTFMVEVSETAAILRAATPRSLVVLDELGRGTSTHDGAAIAQAVLEHVARDTRCLTLFITHYQSIGRAFADAPDICNVHMAFREEDDGSVTFLYEVAPGMAHRSYGLNVARLAHVPARVIAVAAAQSRAMEDDVRRRRLQAAAALTERVLAGADDQLAYLVSSIEQL